MMEFSSLAKEQVRYLPTLPGVYLMKDDHENILYIGKARSLKNRVSTYFSNSSDLSSKTRQMASRVRRIDFIVTPSETEALILELNLIKRYRPFYNIRLKDDKNFPYLKIDTHEQWPRVQITRRVEKDGSYYFGPFSSAKKVRQTLKVIKEIFPFRSCSKDLSKPLARPCLEYDLKKCAGPCVGAITEEEYAEIIDRLILFLEGKETALIHEMEHKMKIAAENKEYEKAARLRDEIRAISKVISDQKVATKVRGEEDVIAFVQEKDQAYVQVFFIRDSKLIGRENFILEGAGSERPEEIMTSFVKQFYDSSSYIPKQIILQYPVDDKKVIEEWLTAKKQSQVRLVVPKKGSQKELVNTVAQNAREYLEQTRIRNMASPQAAAVSLEEITKVLDLEKPPSRIEAYDISDIQGKNAVGSMVVFEAGLPKPSSYRRFKIQGPSHPDDYAMLGEVIRRRFGHLKAGDEKWSLIPDLILIDGGRGQLNIALQVLKDLGLDFIPTIGLAKEDESIFTPQKAEPINLPLSNPGLQLLQRVRDEAHRFALGYHRKVRRKTTFGSALDEISGLGAKRKKLLLQKFGSVRAIKEAPAEEIASLKGIGPALAQRIKSSL